MPLNRRRKTRRKRRRKTRRKRGRGKKSRRRGKKKVTFADQRPSLFGTPLTRRRNLSKTYYKDSLPGEGAHKHLAGTKVRSYRKSSDPRHNMDIAWQDLWDSWDEVLEGEGVGSKYEG